LRYYAPQVCQVGKQNTVSPPLLRTLSLIQFGCCEVNDLAARFADGRLSTEKLAKATDEELEEMLVEVRGIGKVCRHFFLNAFSERSLMLAHDSGLCICSLYSRFGDLIFFLLVCVLLKAG
jgi:hypothetical protein